MPVGKTKDVGWEIGVSRSMPCTAEEAWEALTSEQGLAIWLGEGARLPDEKGVPYETADGTTGELRSLRPLDRLRLTWQPHDWSHDSTVQVVVREGPTSTSVRFHQERLASQAEREAQREHWRGVLDRLEELMSD